MDGAPAAAGPGVGAAASAPATATPAVLVNSTHLEQDETGNKRALQCSPDETAVSCTSESLHRAIALLHEIELNVTQFTHHQQLLLLDRINFFVNELVGVQSAASACNFQIPVEVIRWVA